MIHNKNSISWVSIFNAFAVHGKSTDKILRRLSFFSLKTYSYSSIQWLV